MLTALELAGFSGYGGEHQCSARSSLTSVATGGKRQRGASAQLLLCSDEKEVVLCMVLCGKPR
jgi:hypothetical protein